MPEPSPQSSPQPDLSQKKVFTTGEAAQVCKVSQQTIIRCFDSGRLSGFRVPGSKFRRIPREELMRFMRDNDIPIENLEGPTRRILCVDDDLAILGLFTDILGADRRFEVETCSAGYDAGLRTAEFKPHLIVLDYMLPDINGDAVCKRLRENDDFAATKIIFISGVIEPGEVDKLMAAGADAFIQKPFDIDQLTGTIEQLLDLPAASGANANGPKTNGPSTNGPSTNGHGG